MKVNKKIKMLLGCLSTAAMILAGCSSSTTSASNTTSSGGASSGKTTITFGFYGNADELKVYENLAALYQKTHPNVVIKEVYADPAGFIAKLPTLIRSNSLPDVVNVAESWISQLDATSQPFADLTPYLNKDGIKESDYVKGTWEPAKKDGKILALPNVVYGDAVAYNIDLFNKNHIPLPKAGWTTQDFLNDAKALTNGSGSNKVWGISQQPDYMHTANLFGGKLFDDKANKMQATSPLVEKAVQFESDLMNKYNVMPNTIVTANTIDPFLTGNAAMDTTWVSYDQASWSSEIGNKFKWGLAPFPADWQGVLQENLTAISQASPNKDADWAFVKWLCTDPQALKIQGELSSPANLNALKEWESNPPADWANVDRASSVATLPRSPYGGNDGGVYTEVWNDFNTVLQAIQKGQPVKQALTSFQQTEQDKLDQASQGN